MKHRKFLWTRFPFGLLAANVRVRWRDFSKLRVYAVYSNRHLPSLFGEHCEILRWQTLRKTLKRWWERPEKWRRWWQSPAGRDGDETKDETGDPGDETSDEMVATAGDEMAATSGVMYMDEGELEFDEDEMAALEGWRLVAEFCQIPAFSRTLKASMRVSRQEISVPETTVDRKRSPSRMMMKSVMCRLSDAAAAAAFRTNPTLLD